MLTTKQQGRSTRPAANLTVPELEQSKISVLATLPSAHSRRTYRYAIERFIDCIDWYCSEPRLAFNRCAVVRYRSFFESLALSAADKSPSLCDPSIGRRVCGEWMVEPRAGNWNPTGQRSQTAWTEARQLTDWRPGPRVT
jgi:hypothetical protein